MNISRKVMQLDICKVCLLVATLALECVWSVAVCELGKSWWDREQGACVPCTRCDPARRLAVKYPCQVHRDAVCHSLYDIRIWPFDKPQPQNDTEHSEQYSDYDSAVSDTEVGDDVLADDDESMSTVTIAMAWCSACIVFFVGVLCWSVYHTAKWRVMKQALKSDVRSLSAKLKLMEANIETPEEPIVSTDHHLYCNIHVGKDELLGPTSAKKGLGNVYTQEKH